MERVLWKRLWKKRREEQQELLFACCACSHQVHVTLNQNCAAELPNLPPGEAVWPHVQPEPPDLQFLAVAACSVPCHRWEGFVSAGRGSSHPPSGFLRGFSAPPELLVRQETQGAEPPFLMDAVQRGHSPMLRVSGKGMNPCSISLSSLPCHIEARVEDKLGPPCLGSFHLPIRAEGGTAQRVGRGFPGASSLLVWVPHCCPTKAALFLPTTIPCPQPSAFRPHISCPLAALQEAARARDVDGKRMSGRSEM